MLDSVIKNIDSKISEITTEFNRLGKELKRYRKARALLGGSSNGQALPRGGGKGNWAKVKKALESGLTSAKDIRNKTGLTVPQVGNSLQLARRIGRVKLSHTGWNLIESK